jgi:hypothetical protein
MTTSASAGGVTFSLTCSVIDLTTDMREVTCTVSWTRSGTTTVSTATGSWLQQLSFTRPSTTQRTYTRTTTSWFTKYGLNHAAQRS